MFLDLLRSAHGDKLLRMKGIIELAEDPARPLVIHGVQTLFHPPVRLPAWPDDDRGTRLVLITLDMPEDYVRRMFAAFTNTPEIDTPDRAAVEHNPLAIAGMHEPDFGKKPPAPAYPRAGLSAGWSRDNWPMGGRGQPVIGPITRRYDKGSAGSKKIAKSDFFRGPRSTRKRWPSAVVSRSIARALIRAEGRNVDHCQRIGGFEPRRLPEACRPAASSPSARAGGISAP